MKTERQKTTKTILVRYQDGLCWEAWDLRFNRGSKKERSVKFFADRIWRSDCAVKTCPFDATHFDSSSERDAEAAFAQELITYQGVVVRHFTKALLEELNAILDAERILAARSTGD